MVEQASGLAENAADHSEEFGHRVGFEFRCGVEDFLSGIFRGVGLNERGHRGFRRGGRGRRAFFNVSHSFHFTCVYLGLNSMF